MKVSIRGKIWTLQECNKLPADIDGDCDSPITKNKLIRIRSSISGQRLLDVLCHEVSHAALWDLGEGPIESLANAIAHQLWDQNVRPDQKTSKRTEEKLEQAIIGIIWTRGEIAMFDEVVRREVANAIGRLLRRLGWAHTT
jgi:hypothetical protein